VAHNPQNFVARTDQIFHYISQVVHFLVVIACVYTFRTEHCVSVCARIERVRCVPGAHTIRKGASTVTIACEIESANKFERFHQKCMIHATHLKTFKPQSSARALANAGNIK
jgi:hypothetical protein